MTEEKTSENITTAAEPITSRTLLGKKRTKSKPIIGFDPLAWLKEESESIDEIEVSKEPNLEVTEDPEELHAEEIVDEVVADQIDDNQEIAEVSDEDLLEEDLEETVEVYKPDLEEMAETEEKVLAEENLEVEQSGQISDQKNDQTKVMEMQKFKLEGTITIAEVAELHDQFKTFISQDQSLEIDCSEISGIDAAALQLLVSLMKESSKKDNTLIWQEPSDTFQMTVQMMGLKDDFKM